ncbi:MAG: hypothetical protein ACE5HX_05055 [bacterium]
MNSKFDSTSMILETIWFAKEAIDYDNEKINWQIIDEAKENILFMPSSTELIRLDIAKQLWNGHGQLLDYFVPLDKKNRQKLLKALSIRLSEI